MGIQFQDSTTHERTQPRVISGGYEKDNKQEQIERINNKGGMLRCQDTW